jgi:hypothetical protein
VEGFGTSHLKQLALRIFLRSFDRNDFKGYEEDVQKYMDKVNAVNDETAMVDYRNERKLTPIKALEQIGEIREENRCDNEQTSLLDDLESYVKNRFQVSKIL